MAGETPSFYTGIEALEGRWLLTTLIAYMCFAAIVLLNGLIGIFSNSFDVQDRPHRALAARAAGRRAAGGAQCHRDWHCH